MVRVGFDDSIIQDTAALKAQDMAEVGMTLAPWEYRARWCGESEAVAAAVGWPKQIAERELLTGAVMPLHACEAIHWFHPPANGNDLPQAWSSGFIKNPDLGTEVDLLVGRLHEGSLQSEQSARGR